MRGPRARAFALIAALLTVLTLTAGGCEPSPSGQHAEPEVSYPELPTGPTGSQDEHNRQAQAPVPKGMMPKAVEFASADEGYALFEGCVAGKACQVALAVTLDGGWSWVSRRLPFDDATGTEMRLGRGNVLMLRLDPHGWLISRDSGRTFQQRLAEPPPPELNLAGPQFQIGCVEPGLSSEACGAGARPLEVDAGGGKHALPSQPAATNLAGLALGGDGRLWLVAYETDSAANPVSRTVTAWVSADRGRTWSPAGSTRYNPASVGSRAAVVVSPDGADVWIVDNGYAAKRASDGRWVEATAMREMDRFASAEAMPGGKLLVVGAAGIWSLDLQQRYGSGRARGVFGLRRIDAGLVQGYVGQQGGEVWLCAWTDPRCEWTRVSVSAPQS